MPHDKRGEELKVGDTVMVPCRIKAIHLTEDYCNIDLETRLVMPPLDKTTQLTLNSRQTIKPTASHRFAEYGGAKPDPAVSVAAIRQLLADWMLRGDLTSMGEISLARVVYKQCAEELDALCQHAEAD